MNFFEHQEQAERKTFRLVVLYTLAVVLTFCAVHLLVSFIYAVAAENIQEDEYGRHFDSDEESLISAVTNPILLLADFGVVVLIIGGGTLYKISELKGMGGDGIAQSFGGVRISPTNASLKEKRLLNIVDEMSIASGIHVPNVYVLRNEQGINAFAAGFTANTSVVAVTQGALDYLTRDELQGVLAHEFSHILHRDTYLNLKLIGILFGLEILAMLGYILLRCTPNVVVTDRDDKGSGSAIVVVMLVLGIGLFVIGLIGQLFANIIRAAISRQREFLADASAVQYTRNPDGIAGALKKIGSSVGAQISNNNAISASHIFFGNALSPGFFSHLFDSHPNLTTRIKRIDPSFRGDYPKTIQKVVDYTNVNDSVPKKPNPLDELAKRFPLPPMGGNTGTPISGGAAAVAAAILSSAGEVTENKLRVADALLEKIPQTVSDAMFNRFGAIGALLAVLLDTDPKLREMEVLFLQENLDADTYAQTLQIADALKGSSDSVKIPIVQKAFPFLRNLSKSDYLHLRRTIDKLMKFDGRIDILEFTIAGFVVNDLDIYFQLAPPAPEKYSDPKQIAEPFRKVASFMAYAGSSDQSECAKAFSDAARSLGIQAEILPKSACVPSEFSNSVKMLTFSSKQLRQKILTALYSCITSDGYINEREGELIRAVTAHFQCPMPTWGA